MDALKIYSREKVLSEYKTDIKKKINSLLVRWEEVLGNNSNMTEEAEKQILDYVMFNKRCKLPWSISEVKESVDKLLNLIKHYQEKDKKTPGKFNGSY